MLPLLKEKLLEVLKAVAPLFIMVCVLQLTLVSAPTTIFIDFIGGLVFIVAGMLFLFAGVDYGILPMGKYIGSALPEKGSIVLVVAVAFAFGFATTVAEPDVLVLANQVNRVTNAISRQAVLYAIALGVAVFTAIAMSRIVFGFSLRGLLTVTYGAMIVLSFFAPAQFVPLSYDAGSVTTGVLTAPVVISIAIGLSSVLAGRSAISDGFGLLGFASVGPIFVMMVIGMFLR
ncbi:DUF1538 domain-containing protein [Methylocystis sp. H62]|jgi:hypothetical protein|uniref:DUF1538 domain-containing protein n=1 Tax=Methylocystis rosea TaxID=173366 RepID=A0A3G8MD03_9HYPH|nr:MULTISPECIES: DUF1538 domain-containing protein [Methylocystis]MBA4100576.1 DUF1538 domain-containing protein [Rhodospirillum sp.]MBG0797305.1 DUF1538 domain-containing protein [Methylocystis sp. L43]AZG79060.1 DUF1538 domain-containing protein [Methylocystis rosea]MBG0792758.1 DUF1538 domain-containing protein [Methylocystis sp. H62]MBG0804670.1 DUF1538 domain-containing protein [Methylocystis sp. H15]